MIIKKYAFPGQVCRFFNEIPWRVKEGSRGKFISAAAGAPIGGCFPLFRCPPAILRSSGGLALWRRLPSCLQEQSVRDDTNTAPGKALAFQAKEEEWGCGGEYGREENGYASIRTHGPSHVGHEEGDVLRGNRRMPRRSGGEGYGGLSLEKAPLWGGGEKGIEYEERGCGDALAVTHALILLFSRPGRQPFSDAWGWRGMRGEPRGNYVQTRPRP